MSLSNLGTVALHAAKVPTNVFSSTLICILTLDYYDISPILKEIFSLKMGCTDSFIFGYSSYFLSFKKNIEPIYRNMYLLIRELIIMAYLSVKNILF